MAEEAKREEFPGVSPWDVLIWKLDSLEKYVQREIGDLRREIGDLRQEIGDLRREVRETRRSFTVLELTTIIGFLAVMASILAARFL
jgi:hypothetical protein